MNWLTLAQRVARDSGAGSAFVTGITNQAGQAADIVSYVQEAWLEIQALHRWTFLEAEVDVAFVAGQREYVLTAVGINDFDEAIGERMFVTKIDGTKYPIAWCEPPEFRRRTMLYTNLANATPIMMSVYDGSIWLDQPPDEASTLNFAYRRQPVAFTSQTSEPPITEACQNTIVGKALIEYGTRRNAPEVIQLGTKRYRQGLLLMTSRYLPDIQVRQRPIA